MEVYMIENNKENREKLADKVFMNMEEDEIRLLAYKGLLKIYENSPAVFEHDYRHVSSYFFVDVIE